MRVTWATQVFVVVFTCDVFQALVIPLFVDSAQALDLFLFLIVEILMLRVVVGCWGTHCSREKDAWSGVGREA